MKKFILSKKILLFVIIFFISFNVNALTTDYDKFEPPTYDEKLLKLNYAKSFGTLFNDDSKSSMVSATSDGGYVVLITSYGNCPSDSAIGYSVGTASTNSTTNKQSKHVSKNHSSDSDKATTSTTNKWKYDIYVDNCSILVKYNVKGEELWRSDPLNYSYREKSDGSFDKKYLSNTRVLALEEINDSILLVTNDAYFNIDSSNGKFKDNPKAIQMQYEDESKRSDFHKKDQYIYDGLGSIRSGYFLTFDRSHNALLPVEKDNKIYLAKVDFINETYDDNISLYDMFKNQLNIDWHDDFYNSIDVFVKTVDGYLISPSGSSSIYFFDDNFNNLKLLVDNVSRYNIYNFVVNKSGDMLIGEIEDIVPGDGYGDVDISTGWTIKRYGNKIFDKNGKLLGVIPHTWSREQEKDGFSTHEYGEFCFDYAYGALGLKSNRWLVYGSHQKTVQNNSTDYQDDENNEGFWLYDTDKNLYDNPWFDFESSHYDDDGNETSSKNYDFSYDEADFVELKDGSIVIVGEGYDDDDQVDEDGIHYDITCPNGNSGCSNAVIKRYLINHNKINISSGAGGVVKTNVKDNNNVDQDTLVTVSVEAKPGYKLTSLVITTSDGETINLSDNKFVMPARDVNIKAEFKLSIVNPQTIGGIFVIAALISLVVGMVILTIYRYKKSNI